MGVGEDVTGRQDGAPLHVERESGEDHLEYL